jgi:hypothetical protein
VHNGSAGTPRLSSGNPAQWLSGALAGVDVFALNVKGSKPDDVLCMVRLSELEKLMAAAKGELNECKNERL